MTKKSLGNLKLSKGYQVRKCLSTTLQPRDNPFYLFIVIFMIPFCRNGMFIFGHVFAYCSALNLIRSRDDDPTTAPKGALDRETPPRTHEDNPSTSLRFVSHGFAMLYYAIFKFPDSLRQRNSQTSHILIYHDLSFFKIHRRP